MNNGDIEMEQSYEEFSYQGSPQEEEFNLHHPIVYGEFDSKFNEVVDQILCDHDFQRDI